VRIVRSRWPLLLGTFVALVAAGALGYAIGHHRSSAGFRIRTGMATLVEGGEGTVSFARDDADGLNPGIRWIDGDGSVHEGGSPSCLRPGHERRVTVGTVIYPLPFGGGHDQAVVWVSC
jgi:hypothetical protein